MRKLKNTTTLQNDDGLLSGLQCNELGMQVHCKGGQRGDRHHFAVARVVFLSFLMSALFLSLLQAHPHLKQNFTKKTFP